MCFFSLQLRYKETFQKTKGRYHTVKDALDIVYHRKVTDDISKVCPYIFLFCGLNNLPSFPFLSILPFLKLSREM